MRRIWISLGLLVFVFLVLNTPARWYEKQTRLDPIYAMPGTDTDAFHAAVESLQKAAQFIAAQYPSEEAEHIRSVLVPARSLHAAAALEDSRREFLENPTVYYQLRYALRLEYALYRLEKDAHALETRLRAFTDRPSLFVFTDARMNIQTLADGLAGFSAMVREKRAEARRRIPCSFIKECGFVTTSPEPMRPLSRELTPEDEESLRVIGLINDELDVYESTYPKLIRMRSVCSAEPETLVQVNAYEAHSGGTARRTFTLPDILMYEYTDSPYATAGSESPVSHDPAVARFFAEGDVDYTYQPDGNFYFCLQAGADVAKIGRLLGLYEALSRDRAANAPYLASLDSAVLDAFLNSAFIDEYEASRVSEDIAAALLIPDAPRELAELHALSRAGTYRAQDVIDAAVQLHDFFIALLDAEKSTPHPQMIYTIRGFTTVAFPFYNETIVSRAPSLARDYDRILLASGDTTTYARLKAFVPTQTLDDALVRYARFINENRAHVRELVDFP